MKVLIVGDIHVKLDILDRVKKLGENYDQVIFLGDYVDDWGVIPEGSYNSLIDVIEYKKANPDKVILLLGNHDISEWRGGHFRCSGYNEISHSLLAPGFEKNRELFKLAHYEHGFLFSHAGFTNAWVNHYFFAQRKDPEYLVKLLNLAVYGEDDFDLFMGIGDVGIERGGYKDPSPIWADELELKRDWLPIPQVVGHTPQRTVNFYNKYDKEIYFCDTFSTDMQGKYYGDCTLLTFNDGLAEIIDLDGKVLV